MYKFTSDLFHPSPVARTLGLSITGVLLGGLLYLLFRSTALTLFPEWIPSGHLEFLRAVRTFTLNTASLLPAWVVYSFPGGLWAFSYALLITGIWAGSSPRVKYFWLALMAVVVIGSEGLQGLGLLPGTFCLQDLLLGVAGMATGIALGNYLTRPLPARNRTLRNLTHTDT